MAREGHSLEWKCRTFIADDRPNERTQEDIYSHSSRPFLLLWGAFLSFPNKRFENECDCHICPCVVYVVQLCDKINKMLKKERVRSWRPARALCSRYVKIITVPHCDVTQPPFLSFFFSFAYDTASCSCCCWLTAQWHIQSRQLRWLLLWQDVPLTGGKSQSAFFFRQFREWVSEWVSSVRLFTRAIIIQHHQTIVESCPVDYVIHVGPGTSGPAQFIIKRKFFF